MEQSHARADTSNTVQGDGLLPEVQSLYTLSTQLLSAQDMMDVLRALRLVLTPDAQVILHLSVDVTGQAVVRHQMSTAQEKNLYQVLDVSFADADARPSLRFVENIETDSSVPAKFVAQYGARSYVQMSWVMSSQICEIVLISFDRMRPFDNRTRRLLEVFASQAGIAIQNQYLLRETQTAAARMSHQIRVLQTLNLLAHSISEKTDDDTLMLTVARSLVEVSDADHAGIALIQPDGKTAVVISEFPSHQAIGTRFEVETSPVFDQMLAGSNRPIWIEQVDTDSRLLPATRASLQGFGICSIIIAPLRIGERLIGTVGLDLYTKERSFSRDASESIEVLVNQLAAYLQTVEERRDQQRSALQSQVLERASARFVTVNRVDSLLQEAVTSLQQAFSAQRVVIRLGQPEDAKGDAV